MNTSRSPLDTSLALDAAACITAYWITRSNPAVGSGSTLAVPGTGGNPRSSTSDAWDRSVSTLAPHAWRMRRAPESCVSATSRCSSPTESWRRARASLNARCTVSSVSAANGTGDRAMLFAALLGIRLHRHEERIVLLFGRISGCLDLGGRHVVGEHARHAEP